MATAASNLTAVVDDEDEEGGCWCPEHPDGLFSLTGFLPLSWWFYRPYGEGVDDDQRENVLVTGRLRSKWPQLWSQ